MTETSSDALPEPAKSKRRKGGGFKLLTIFLLILALVAGVVYHLSFLNASKFFLVPEGDKLLIKRGVFFLAGSEQYKGRTPEEEKLENLYDPIALPTNFGSVQKEFRDLASLNQEFAAILFQQAQQLVFAPEDASYQKGKAYLERLDKLPGLDANQLKKIQGLEADVNYIEAKRSYLGVEKILGNALKKFKQAETFGTGRFPDARIWIEKVELLLLAIRNTKASLSNTEPEAPKPAVPVQQDTIPAIPRVRPEVEPSKPAAPELAPEESKEPTVAPPTRSVLEQKNQQGI